MNKIELLAPARDCAAGLDAINCGADAVYIGAEEFGARAGAANTVHDIERLCFHARRYGAKIYAAVNTILSDHELIRAQRLISRLWTAGVDAVIVQDMGLVEADLPPVPLLASTQAHNITPQKVLFLEKAGFRRVILGRELSLAEIKKIRAATDVELGFFIHGGLCVSYSGLCYASYALEGRGANRGLCSQPCRKIYTLKDRLGNVLVEKKHLLSLRDLNLTKRLGALVDAGVTSLMIEGRLRDAAYVRNIVSHYRAALDGVLASRKLPRSSNGKSFLTFAPNPAKTFNRGYCEYFVNGSPADISSADTPKFVGEPLGRAYEVKNGSFKLQGAQKLNPGDGISFFDGAGSLNGSLVNGVKDGRVRAENLRGIENGTPIYRNFDKEFIRQVGRCEPQRKLGVKLEFCETESGFQLKAADEMGAATSAEIKVKKAPAKKPEQALETIQKQLSKLGESDYYLEALEIKLTGAFFIQVSVLNDLRRDALAALAKLRVKRVREEVKIKPNSYPYPDLKLDFTGNVLNSKAEAFYRRHGVTEVARAAEDGLDMRGKPVMTMKLCLRLRLGLCQKGRPVEPLRLEDESGREFRMDFDCQTCVVTLTLEK